MLYGPQHTRTGAFLATLSDIISKYPQIGAVDSA